MTAAGEQYMSSDAVDSPGLAAVSSLDWLSQSNPSRALLYFFNSIIQIRYKLYYQTLHILITYLLPTYLIYSLCWMYMELSFGVESYSNK